MKDRIFAPVFLVILSACTAVAVYGRQTSAPFAELDSQVRSRGGWNEDPQILAGLFNAERKRLGDRFEPELMTYLGQDVEKHYWISLYLEDESYLQGATPLPQLSLLIKEQGLALLEGKEDFRSLSNVVRLSVAAALLSERLGFYQLAVSRKVRTERLVQKNPELKNAIPAMSGEERALYDALPLSYTGPNWKRLQLSKRGTAGAPGDPAGADSAPKRIRLASGVLAAAAIKRVEAAYPPEAKKAKIKGVVRVEVVVSEAGKVLEATAIEGPEQLREAAIAAARQWEFKPVELAGRPVEVTGVLNFKFPAQ